MNKIEKCILRKLHREAVMKDNDKVYKYVVKKTAANLAESNIEIENALTLLMVRGLIESETPSNSSRGIKATFYSLTKEGLKIAESIAIGGR